MITSLKIIDILITYETVSLSPEGFRFKFKMNLYFLFGWLINSVSFYLLVFGISAIHANKFHNVASSRLKAVGENRWPINAKAPLIRETMNYIGLGAYAMTQSMSSSPLFSTRMNMSTPPGDIKRITNSVVSVVNGIKHKRLGGGDIIVSEIGLGTQRWCR